MKNRIKKEKKSIALSLIIPIVSFTLCMIMFLYGLDTLSKASSRQALSGLEEAINKDILHCYASQGYYPPDVSYMEDNYGLTIDRNSFEVIYSLSEDGSFPKVEVRELK